MSTPTNTDFRAFDSKAIDLEQCRGQRRKGCRRLVDGPGAGVRGTAGSDDSPEPPRRRTPDLNDGTGDFGWPMVNRLARATTVTRQETGGRP